MIQTKAGAMRVCLSCRLRIRHQLRTQLPSTSFSQHGAVYQQYRCKSALRWLPRYNVFGPRDEVRETSKLGASEDAPSDSDSMLEALNALREQRHARITRTNAPSRVTAPRKEQTVKSDSTRVTPAVQEVKVEDTEPPKEASVPLADLKLWDDTLHDAQTSALDDIAEIERPMQQLDQDQQQIRRLSDVEHEADIESENTSDPVDASLEYDDTFPNLLEEDQQKPNFSNEVMYQATIGVDALGMPVRPFVLRDPSKMERTRRRDEPITERDEPNTPFDLHHFLDSYRDIVDDTDPDAEVFRNIQEIRPTDTHVLSSSQLSKLQSQLQDGFTEAQLKDYTRAHDTRLTKEYWDYPWITNQQHWVPLSPDVWGDLGSKDRAILQILFRIWQLETRDQQAKLGTSVISVDHSVYWLLARPDSPLLETMRNDLLDGENGETLHCKRLGYGSRPALVFQTRKSSMASVLGRFDAIAKQIVRRDIVLPDLQGKLRPTDKLMTNYDRLETLGKLTDTFIRFESANKTLSVSWLPSKDRPAPPAPGSSEIDPLTTLEDPADIVFRLMFKRDGKDRPQRYQVQNIAPEAASAEMVVDHRELRSLSARDKTIQPWARKVMPLTQNQGIGSQPKRIAYQKSPAAKSADEARIVATFGHILHCVRPVSLSNQVLAPVVPHIAALTAITSKAKAEDVTSKTTIVLNFEPDPMSEPRDIGPIIQLRIPVYPNADLANFQIPNDAGLHAVIEEGTDIGFPAEAVDARILQQRLISLDLNAKPIQTFLHSSEFNLANGILRTPSRTTFNVPYHTSLTDKKPVSVNYLFVGLSIHQTVETSWEDKYTIKYDSIEAGLHGGQRRELSLIAEAGATAAAGKRILASFLNVVGDVASGKYFSWTNGGAAMKELKVEDLASQGDDVQMERSRKFLEDMQRQRESSAK